MVLQPEVLTRPADPKRNQFPFRAPKKECRSKAIPKFTYYSPW